MHLRVGYANQKKRLRNFEIEQIVTIFRERMPVDNFSVCVSYDDIREKGYFLSAGQYFDIKIEYVDITEKEFNARMASFLQTLIVQFEESHRLEKEIKNQPDSLKFNE